MPIVIDLTGENITTCYFCDKLLLMCKKPYHLRCKQIHEKIEKLRAKKDTITHELEGLCLEEYSIRKPE